MARKHDNRMTSRSNTTVNKAYLEKVTKSVVFQANEKKAHQFEKIERQIRKDHSVRSKE